MKKTFVILFAFIALALSSCYDEYKSDYDYTTAYFAYQYPLRELIVEREVVDNKVVCKDLEINLGVALGGKYTNETTERITFELAPDSALAVGVKVLPESYYTLSDANTIEIKAGEFVGTVNVSIDADLFLADDSAHLLHYALPLRMTSYTTDSVLEGQDYTVYAIRYLNPYHGKYYLNGVDYTLGVDGLPTDTSTYSPVSRINSRIVDLNTAGRDDIVTSYVGSNTTGDKNYFLNMNIGLQDGSVILSANDDSELKQLAGTGSYNDQERMFTMSYRYYDEAGAAHQVMDTLYHLDTPLEKIPNFTEL